MALSVNILSSMLEMLVIIDRAVVDCSILHKNYLQSHYKAES